MEILKMWAVWQNTDGCEGRGKEYIQYYCFYESTAKKLAEKNYVMGTNCPITEINVFHHDGKYFPETAEIYPVKTVLDLIKEEIKRDFHEHTSKYGLSEEQIELIKREL